MKKSLEEYLPVWIRDLPYKRGVYCRKHYVDLQDTSEEQEEEKT